MNSTGSSTLSESDHPHPIVNVCSCGSSGSTLLAQAIDRHPQIACGDEMFFFCSPMLYDQYERVKKWHPAVRLLGLSGNPYHQGRALFRHGKAYGLSRSRLWRWVTESSDFTSLTHRVRDHVLERTGKQVWAEKTPRNIRVINKFLEAFPHARVIHIVRDPRDVIASLMGRNKHFLEAAEAWIASLAAIAPFRHRTQVLEIHYENLCRQPEQVLEKICDFLQLEFDPDYFNSDRFTSSKLGKFEGHESWKVRPTEAFTTQSIGRHEKLDLDWQLISQIRLTKPYADMLGTQQWSLGELARAYGYDLNTDSDEVTSARYSEYESGWQLSAIRRKFDETLGIPPFINIIEYPEQLDKIG